MSAAVDLTEIIGSVWFRALAPVVVCAAYELIVRYSSKPAAQQGLGREGWFIAIPLVGSAITAFPALLALRAKDGEAVAAGSWALTGLVLAAWWLVVYNNQALRLRREDGGFWGGTLGATAIPNMMAATCLGLVFAFAP